MSKLDGSLTAAPPFLGFLREDASLKAARLLAQTEGWPADAVQPGGIAEALTYLKTHPSPTCLLVEIAEAASAPDLLNALADVCAPHTRVLVTSTVNEFSFYQWLMDIGIEGYLLQPFTEQALKRAIQAKPPAESTKASAAKPGTVTAFIGARGGVGTTTVAANLAWLLGHTHQRKTALVDLDIHFGSASLAFDLEPSRGLSTLFETPERIDGLFLERVMTKLDGGLSVLGAEEPLKEAVTGKAQAAETLLARLKEKHEYVLIDLPRTLNPLTRAVLAGCDRLVIVAEPTLLSLRDTVRWHDFAKDTLGKQPPIVILNRMPLQGKAELKRVDFEKHFGRPVQLALPFMPEAAAATANGEMLVQAAPKAPGVAALQSLAREWTGVEAETKAPPRRWRYPKG